MESKGQTSAANWVKRLLACAAIIGALPGLLLGLILACFTLAFWDFHLDGPGWPAAPTPVEVYLLLLGYPVAGAAAGAALAVAVTAIWAWFTVEPENQIRLVRGLRILVGLSILFGVVLLILARVKPFAP